MQGRARDGRCRKFWAGTQTDTDRQTCSTVLRQGYQHSSTRTLENTHRSTHICVLSQIHALKQTHTMLSQRTCVCKIMPSK